MKIDDVIELNPDNESGFKFAKVVSFDRYYVTFKGRSGKTGRFSGKITKWSRRKFHQNKFTNKKDNMVAEGNF